MPRIRISCFGDCSFGILDNLSQLVFDEIMMYGWNLGNFLKQARTKNTRSQQMKSGKLREAQVSFGWATHSDSTHDAMFYQQKNGQGLRGETYSFT